MCLVLLLRNKKADVRQRELMGFTENEGDRLQETENRNLSRHKECKAYLAPF